MPWTVSQVAKLASCTVRTLHHYDELGLLTPSGRTEAGYRLYVQTDLDRLREILLLRQLGFSLEAIGGLLEQSPGDRRAALRVQRKRLVEQSRQTAAVIAAIDAALEMEGDETMPTDEMFQGFDQFDHARYEEEARERWGETEAFKESARRTRSYSQEDWARLGTESQATLDAFATLLDAGAPADGVAAMEAAEAARHHIDRWFYPCSRQMHALLGQGYVSDPRFAAFYERVRPGMAAYVNAAIQANAARGG